MRIYRFFTANGKKLALLLSIILLLTLVMGGTVAFIVTRTPSLLNTFVSGLDPTGDLVIRKQVIHPFGDTYQLPDSLSFDFTVGLGEKYANKTVQTSQGAKTADESGNIAVSIQGSEAVRIPEILLNTQVTVTEAEKPGFTVGGENPRTLTVARGDNETVFTNTYAPAPVSPVNLTVTGTKVLEGRPWQTGDSFTFRLEYKRSGEEAQWESLGTATVAYEQIQIQDPQFPDDPEKLIWVDKPDFDKFSFTELVQALSYPAAGTYSFRVSEVEGTIGGVGYDSVVSYFDVLVGDADMDGTLEIQNVIGYQNAAAAYDEATKTFGVEVTVNNTYAPEGTATATIHIQKTVTSLSGEEKSLAGYTFELYDENGALVKTSGATSAAGETFIQLTFEAKDAGKTFRYILKETNAGKTLNGMTYDATEHAIDIAVVDDLDGTVSAYVYPAQDTPDAPEETTDPVEEAEAATDPVDTTVEENEEATDPVDTTVEENEETTDPVDTEVEEAEAVTDPVDTTVEETEAVTEPVETTPENTIPADASDTLSVTFENIYDPADTRAAISGTKKLAGRNLGTGDFTFDLYVTGGDFAVAENAKPVQSVPNDGAGAFAFAAIKYDKVGTYHYVVKENTGRKLGGVTYDATAYRITVTVTDENGQLTAVKTVTDELGKEAELIFRNTYTPEKATLIFAGTKSLTGGGLTDWSFDFLLYKADAKFTVQGDAMDQASSDTSGSFTFKQIEFTAAGDYYYVITEDASAAVEGMEYDTAVYQIHVSVTDDGAGQLHADVTCYLDGEKVDAISFTNVYTAPATEPPETTEPTEPDESTKPVDPDSPPTGDETPVGLYIAILVLSAAAIVVLILLGNRKKKQ